MRKNERFFALEPNYVRRNNPFTVTETVLMNFASARVATLAATACFLSAQGLAQTPSLEPMIPASGTILDVTARGSTTRVPDLATIRAGVVSDAATATAALNSNAERMTAVLGALKKVGINDRDIATDRVNLQPQYRYGDNKPPVLTGYQATNTVSIRFRDISRAGKILDTLVTQGANTLDGPNLSIDKPDAALDEARLDAIKRARARADLYAKASGLGVERIVSISESGTEEGDRPRPLMYMRAAEAKAPTAISAGEQDVTVNLSVRFLLR